MRIKYFIAYNWFNTEASGVGRLEVFYDKHIAGAEDLERIEKIISKQAFHDGKNNRIVITNWHRFETPIRDRKISRLALAKGLR